MSEQRDNRDEFIPQHLLNNLAERGNENAKRTLSKLPRHAIIVVKHAFEDVGVLSLATV